MLHRKSIVELRRLGKTHASISQELSIPVSTVKVIWLRYKKEGEAGLETRYRNSGIKAKRSPAGIYRAAMWLKRLHPGWGAGRIRIGLLGRYGSQALPSERTLQRWFREKKSV